MAARGEVSLKEALVISRPLLWIVIAGAAALTYLYNR